MLIYVHASEREFFSKTIMNIIKNIKSSSILRGERPLAVSIFAVIVIVFCLLGVVMPQATSADFANPINASYVAKATNKAINSPATIKTIKVKVTAYASLPEQTSDHPFITASGKHVEDGIVANNMLPFGTKIRIPGLYGDKVFIVEDRMASFKSDYHIDIWMPDNSSAVNFGVKMADVEIL